MALDHWEISVESARTIVSDAREDAERLQGQEDALIRSFTDAAMACDHLDIGAALDSLLHDFAGPLLQAARGAGLSITGQTGKAIEAYVSADETMAERAENAVDLIPDTSTQYQTGEN